MRTYRQLTMGLLALLLCFSLPSCSDDDDEKNEKEAIQEEQKGMVELLNLQMNLCLVNLQGEPTEATFGRPLSEANTTERIYYTKDLDSAKKRYQLLFHSDTKCSEDGNTYTLANKLGTATFAAANGNKGELAVATFDVPGLKGLVTKVHFIDYTQRGENASGDVFDELSPSKIICVGSNDTKWYGITLGPLKGSDDTWAVFTPTLQKDLEHFRPTGFIDNSMMQDDKQGVNIMDYMQSYSLDKYQEFQVSVWCLLFKTGEEYSNAQANQDIADKYYPLVWTHFWPGAKFYFQVKKETATYERSYDLTNVLNWSTKIVYDRYHMLLGQQEYDSRNTLYNIPITVVSDRSGITATVGDPHWKLEEALPLWTTINTVTRGDMIKILSPEDD
ncbi:MAG: hypothetical protein ACI4C3_02090 [Bacteroides sp.]